MKFCNVFIAAVFTVAFMGGAVNAQITLVNDGDFSAADSSTTWGVASVGADASFPTTGGNTDGHGRFDQTAAGWGGVLINDGDTAVTYASLGLTAGDTVTFSIDLIDFADNGVTAGMKIENWDMAGANAIVNDSGDVVQTITTSWETYQFDFTLDAGADAIKFVPLMVGQAQGSSVGFDNVGFVTAVPEPTSLCMIALGVAGIATRRRRS